MESSPHAPGKNLRTGGFPLWAVALSLALHALVLAAFAPERVADETGDVRIVVLQGALLPPPPPAPPAAPPAPAAPYAAPSVSPAVPRPPMRDSTPVIDAPDALDVPAAVPPAPTFVPAFAPVSAAAVPAGVPAGASGAYGPDASGLREYRRALAGEARRFRRYPEAARRAELTGTVEIRIAVAGSARQAELHRSSGHAALDAAALEMLRRAAERTELPASLRGQHFAVLLPVAFEVEE